VFVLVDISRARAPASQIFEVPFVKIREERAASRGFVGRSLTGEWCRVERTKTSRKKTVPVLSSQYSTQIPVWEKRFSEAPPFSLLSNNMEPPPSEHHPRVSQSLFLQDSPLHIHSLSLCENFMLVVPRLNRSYDLMVSLMVMITEKYGFWLSTIALSSAPILLQILTHFWGKRVNSIVTEPYLVCGLPQGEEYTKLTRNQGRSLPR